MLRDLTHFVVGQRREQHGFVDAVAELRREPALELAHHFALHLLDTDRPVQEAHRARQLPEVLRAEIRRHDDDRVAQVDALSTAVRHPALVERLEKQVQRMRARLLDLVEQDDAVRIVFQLIGEDASALASDNTARHADELIN